MNDHLVKRRIEEIRNSNATSIDGFVRSDEAEENINQTLRSALSGEQGEAVMDYLRSISTNVVMHPSGSNEELRSLEGMRRMVGIIDARRKSIAKG
tara:strand:+ start:394 stop:681 length:288 start_codon:yes stop_codon:yes gene_type:complete